ncbi:MAG: dipeptide epimerase [Candidatus Eremiobacterota bacterium]
MRIDRLDIYRSSLRCKKPFRIATGVSDHCSALLVKLTTDTGEVGWGEAAPDPYLTSETLESCEALLRDHFFPVLKGLSVFEIEEVHRRMERAAYGNPSARCGVDLAVYDLLARRMGVTLVEYLGGSARRVLTNYSIGLMPVEEAAQEARRIVEAGYRCVKLKVGDDPDDDVARVRAVRTAIGPDIPLRIDANEGWNYSDALRALTRMEPYSVQLVEQPLARWDLDGMARLRQRVLPPIAADEGVHSPREAARAISAGAVDIINIKLMKSGGLHPARTIVALARTHGVRLMVGGMVGESRLAVTAATALAAAFRFEYADLDADLLLAEDAVAEGGVTLEASERVLPDGPGSGILRLDERYLTLV